VDKLPLKTTNNLYRRWERNTRYYEARLQRDLFGDWILIKVWGQINSPRGRIMNSICNNYIEGQEKLITLSKIREKRGYTMIKSEGGK